jgi:hypothetical protein
MIVIRAIILVLCALSLFHCSEYPAETEILQVNQSAVTSEIPDEDADIIISPVNATARTIITLRTNNRSIEGGKINWYVNDGKVFLSTGYRFIPDKLKKGDIIQATIEDGDKAYHSNKVTLKNTPPVIRKARLLPAMPGALSMLTINIKTDDADGDHISHKYRWTINGTFAGEDNYLDTQLKRDDLVMVEVTPYDGEEYGRSITLEKRIFNSLPVVSESTPAYDGKLYTYQIAATDPDNDSLTFKLEEGPEGMTINPSSGIITWEVSPENEGIHELKVLISDNHGGKILVPVTATIYFQEIQLQNS